MIQVNKELGILIGSMKDRKREADLLFLLPFLVYISNKPEMRPINLLYQEYQNITTGKATPIRKKETFAGREENFKAKGSKSKECDSFEDLDETVADDMDRSISSITNQSDAGKSVTTLKVEIGISHIRYSENGSKANCSSRGDSSSRNMSLNPESSKGLESKVSIEYKNFF